MAKASLSKPVQVGVVIVAAGLVLLAAVWQLVLGGYILTATRWDPDFTVSPDGLTVVFVGAGDGVTDLKSLRLPSGSITRLTKSPDLELSPAFSADGRWVYYAHRRGPRSGGGLRRCGADGANDGPVTSPKRPLADTAPSCSPDGRHLVFLRSGRRAQRSTGGVGWYDWASWLLDLRDGSERRLAVREPDGATKAVDGACFAGRSDSVVDVRVSLDAADLPAGFTVWRIGLDGRQESVATMREKAFEVRVSPDGRSVVYCADADEPFRPEVWLARLDGSPSRRLTHLSSRCSLPQVSLDGAWVYFVREYSGRAIWRVASSGGEPTEVVPPAAVDGRG